MNTTCQCHPVILTMRDVMARNDDHAALYWDDATYGADAESAANLAHAYGSDN